MDKQQLEMLKKLAKNLEWREGPPPKDGAPYEVKIGEGGNLFVKYCGGNPPYAVVGVNDAYIAGRFITAHRTPIGEDEAFLLAALNDAIAELESAQKYPFAELKEYTPPHGHDLSKLRVGEPIVLIPNVADIGARFEAGLIAIDGDALVVEIYKDANVFCTEEDGEGFVHARIPLHKIDAIGQAPKNPSSLPVPLAEHEGPISLDT